MDAEGDKEKAQALYIKHRIRRIKDSDNANMAMAWEQKNDQEIKSTKDGVSGPVFFVFAILIIFVIPLMAIFI